MIVWKTRIFSKDGSYNGFIVDGYQIEFGINKRDATVDEVRERIKNRIEKYIEYEFSKDAKNKLLSWVLEDIEKDPIDKVDVWKFEDETGKKKKFVMW